jgi:protein SCO1/2
MNFRLTLVALTAALVGGLVAFVVLEGPREQLSRALPSTGKALVGGPFTLVDHTGKTVTDKDFRGRFMLVYFGFTNCPDVCPSGLQVMAAALEKVGAKADQVTPILITLVWGSGSTSASCSTRWARSTFPSASTAGVGRQVPGSGSTPSRT